MVFRPVIWILLCFLFVTSIAGTAEDRKVFKSTGDFGQPVFSDRAPDDAQEIEIRDPQTFPARVFEQEFDGFDYGVVQSQADPDQASSKAFTYGSLLISSPQPNQTIRDNAGNLNIEVIVPDLILPQHQVQLVMDETIQAVYSGEAIRLANVDRGTHKLHLEIVDRETGKIEKLSPSVTFNLKRYSKLH